MGNTFENAPAAWSRRRLAATRRVGLLLAWLLLSGAVAGARQSAQSPASLSQPEVIWLDAGPLPSSLQQLWTQTALVVRGEVTSVGEPIRHPGSPSPLAIRFSTIRVIEIVKATRDLRVEPGQVIQVMQFGGTIVDHGREVQTKSSATLLTTGLDAYFFLNKLTTPDAYAIVHDDAGVFPIAPGDLVQVPQLLKHLPELEGRVAVPGTELKKIFRHLRAPLHPRS
jgi:hypothetical protein